MSLGFYEGYPLFGGAATTGVATFTLTGLPGNSASSSFFGGFTCYVLRVQFGQLVCFADGPIGNLNETTFDASSTAPMGSRVIDQS